MRAADVVKRDLEAAVSNQIAYHRSKVTQQGDMERRLGAVGLAAFVGTLMLSLISVLGVTFFEPHFEGIAPFAAVVLVILPAFGSAIFAVRVQSNFKGEATQSAVTLGRLERLHETLTGADAAQGGNASFVAGCVERFLRIQISEFDTWHASQAGRALDLP